MTGTKKELKRTCTNSHQAYILSLVPSYNSLTVCTATNPSGITAVATCQVGKYCQSCAHGLPYKEIQ